ncbi:hypothetical protein GCK32_022817 [Trichostrongylus colubriformis]|uniref:Uncharacterized protein n=1 Tax=Trichostrongylus colubriformis TaxID=6319 RepID=A0AAN8IJ48_TRICO
MSSTPLDVSSLRSTRQSPLNRPCIDLNGSPPSAADLDRHVELLITDESTSKQLKTVLAWLVEDRKQMSSMYNLCKDLSEKVNKLRLENAELKKRIVDPISGTLPPQSLDPSIPPNPSSTVKPVTLHMKILSVVAHWLFMVLLRVETQFLLLVLCIIIKLLGA